METVLAVLALATALWALGGMWYLARRTDALYQKCEQEAAIRAGFEESSRTERADLFKRIGPKHTGSDIIEISLKGLDTVKATKAIPDRAYYVALKDEKDMAGVSIPNYTSAANMGISLAALRVAKEKAKEVKPDGKASVEAKPHEEVKKTAEELSKEAAEKAEAKDIAVLVKDGLIQSPADFFRLTYKQVKD